MKLLFCGYCHDIVRLFPAKRTCKCGRSWGHYLEDNSTTVQTDNTLSLGIANPDFQTAIGTYIDNQEVFSPLLSMRCWINPTSEPDVKFILQETSETTEETA